MKTVWTNGCFDILHRGHVEMFKFAKSLGDELIVGLDTDEKVKESKGSDRPFNNLEDRELVVSSIRYVDKTISFNSQKQLEDLIKTITADQVASLASLTANTSNGFVTALDKAFNLTGLISLERFLFAPLSINLPASSINSL